MNVRYSNCRTCRFRGDEKMCDNCNSGLLYRREEIRDYASMFPAKQVINNIFDMNRAFKINKVIFNEPATIVMWSDGSKTVVKAQDEKFDPEKGLAMAISKKFFGNSGSYYNNFKKWLPKEEAPKKHAEYCKRCINDGKAAVCVDCYDGYCFETADEYACYKCEYIYTKAGCEPCVSCKCKCNFEVKSEKEVYTCD